MASSKISDLNANRFAMVDLGGVWSNSIIPPRFLGWSLEKIKIDKFFKIFQFFVWAIFFLHELTRTSSDFSENGAIRFAMSEIGGVMLTSPQKTFFQRWKSQILKKKKSAAIVQTDIDDMVCAATPQGHNLFYTGLEEQFKIKNLGLYKFCVGIQVNHTDESIELS